MPQKDVQKSTRADRMLPGNVKIIHARGVAVDGKVTSWRIDGYPGLVLRAFSNGSRTWSFRYQMGSGRRGSRDMRYPLGDYATTPLVTAWAVAKDKIKEIESGADPATDRKARNEGPTLREVFELRIKLGRKLKDTTIAGYRSYLDRPSVQHLMKLPIRAVSTEAVIAALDVIHSRGSSRMADNTSGAMSSVFNFALKRKMVGSNPCAGLDKYDLHRPRIRRATNNELRALWTAIPNAPIDDSARNIIRLAMLTGKRRSEIALLQKFQLKLDGEEPAFELPDPKNSSFEIVPLAPKAAVVIREAIANSKDSHWLFPSPRARKDKTGRVIAERGLLPIDPHSVTTAMRRLRDQAGVEDVTLHDQRKFIGTFLGDEGIEDAVIGRLLGHRPKGITNERYNLSGRLRQVRAAMERWERHLMKISGEPESKMPVDVWSG